MLGKLPHKLAGIHQRILHRYFKHRANISFNNLLQRRLSVRRPPDRAGNLVQREERRVRHGHHHRLSGKNPGSDRGTASYIHGPHPRFLMPPNPTPKHPCETLAAALALAAQIHRLPQIWPVPIPYRGQKNRMLRSNACVAKARSTSSMRFSAPCRNRYNTCKGAEQCAPTLANSPANGVPCASYPLALLRTYEISSVSNVASAGASREIVVLPAPDTPAKRNARPFRMALAACTRNSPRF